MLTKKVLQLQKLKGADCTHDPANVDARRSPDCPNMMRSVPGKVRKRMGFQQTGSYEGCINGHYRLDGTEIIHAGTNLYCGGVLKRSDLQDHFSCGFYFDHVLYLLDGATYWVIDENLTVRPARETAYVPQITVSRNPDGSGGRMLECMNLLGSRWTDGFYGTAGTKTYQLSLSGLNQEPVTAQVLSSDGVSRQTLTEGHGITVNRTAGVVTFAAAPGVSPIEGSDNVWITAGRDNSSQRSKIESADVCAVYGAAGSGSRVFVTGCSSYPNRDFWSDADHPTYFPDLNYSVLGQNDGRIMGYTVFGDRIAAHKNDRDGSIYIRRGELTEQEMGDGSTRSNMVFRTGSIITGRGAVSSRSFVQLGGEGLFLTHGGVCALTPSDLTGERYEQTRSYYINELLSQEPNPEDASAILYQDFYLLAFPDGNVYLLDGLQRSYAAGEPHSTFQYECYWWTGVHATCLWMDGAALCFGDTNGRTYAFATERERSSSYYDGTEPVKAGWQIPDLYSRHLRGSRTYRGCSVRLDSALSTSVVGEYRKTGGTWTEILNSGGRARYWSFSCLQFSKITFCCDNAARIAHARLGIHNTGKAGFRFCNREAEPFGLEAVALEFYE